MSDTGQPGSLGEAEVVAIIKDRWPGLGDHASWVLWNHTCFPLCDPNAIVTTDEGNLAHWMKQIEVYVKESAIQWQTLHG